MSTQQRPVRQQLHPHQTRLFIDTHKQRGTTIEGLKQNSVDLRVNKTSDKVLEDGKDKQPNVPNPKSSQYIPHKQCSDNIPELDSDSGGESQELYLCNDRAQQDRVASGGHIHIQQPEITWEQTATSIVLKIFLTCLGQPTVLIENSGRGLSFTATVNRSSADGFDVTTNNVRFSLNFFASIVEKYYECQVFEKYLLLELEKSQDCQFEWPQLVVEEDKSQQVQQEQPNSGRRSHYQRTHSTQPDDYQQLEASHGTNKDCFQDIELYLNQLVKQFPEPSAESQTKVEPQQREFNISKNNDFGTNLKAAFKKYYSNTNQAQQKQESLRVDQICEPKYNVDIFNPFRKASHNLRSKPVDNIDKMKYDYRRGTSSDSGSVIDSGKNTAKHAHDYRKTYLFLYNVLLFVMFLMVFMILTIKVLSGTIDDDSVQGSAFIIKVLTYTQLLESIHPILGLVPGGPMMPFLQVIGRLIVNHFLTEPTIRINSAPYAHYLFIVWSCIEIFRYSFYALRVFNVDVYPITWCRYTLFLPLYPMGGFCESQVIRSTIKQYGKTGTYSVELPNASNISFNLPIFLKFYTYFLLGPSIFYLMRYMWSQRCKQLGKNKDKTA